MMTAVVAEVLLNVVVIAYAGANTAQAAALLWRMKEAQKVGYARHTSAAVIGVTATLFAMLSLIVLSAVTLVYLTFGLTPVDFMAMLGARLPVSFNRGALLIGTTAQAIVKLYAVDHLLRSHRYTFFPANRSRRASDASSDIQSPPPPPPVLTQLTQSQKEIRS